MDTLKEVEILPDGTWHVEKANPIGNAQQNEITVDLEEEDNDNESNGGDSDSEWVKAKKSTDSLLGSLTSVELPFYKQKKVIFVLNITKNLFFYKNLLNF